MFNNHFNIPQLLKDRSVLTESYLPEAEELLYRDAQIGELCAYLASYLSDDTPPHILVLGTKGTGKTTIVKFVLNLLKKEHLKRQENIHSEQIPNHTPNIDILIPYQKGVFIEETLYGYVLRPGTACRCFSSLCRNMGFLMPSRGLSFEDMLLRFEEYRGNAPCIFVIDELDFLPEKELNLLMYHLSRRPYYCTIGISNLFTIQHKITDPSVQSSYKPLVITTSPYNRDELQKILEKRAESAFYPGKIDPKAVSKCSSLATQGGGDCRYGIALLRHAAEIALRERMDQINETHIDKAQEIVEQYFIYEDIQKFKLPHILLLKAVVMEQKQDIQQIYSWCDSHSQFQLGMRSWSIFLQELVTHGYFIINRKSMGWGKGVKWQVTLAEGIDKTILEKTLSNIKSGIDD